jgi:hypothetical protein
MLNLSNCTFQRSVKEMGNRNLMGDFIARCCKIRSVTWRGGPGGTLSLPSPRSRRRRALAARAWIDGSSLFPSSLNAEQEEAAPYGLNSRTPKARNGLTLPGLILWPTSVSSPAHDHRASIIFLAGVDATATSFLSSSHTPALSNRDGGGAAPQIRHPPPPRPSRGF